MRPFLAAAVCAALACAHADKKQRRDPLENACAASGGPACRELGWKKLRGPASAAADRAAARLFMEGCETKDAQSCADLGALYAVGRGVRQDDPRACALGLVDACVRAGLPEPTETRTPTELVAPGAGARGAPVSVDAKETAAAIEVAEGYAKFFIDRDLHERLGATRAALEADPPAPEDDVQLVGRIAALRRWSVSDCLPVYVYPNQNAVPATAWVSFGIGADGRTRAIRVARASKDASADTQERCVADAIARWEFPAPRVGGRLLLRVAGTGQRREAPVVSRGAVGTGSVPGEPAFALDGYKKPAMAEPGCVQRRIRPPRSTLPQTVLVKFAVGPAGETDRFEVMAPVDETPVPLARAIAEAIGSCRWTPGADREGRPIPVWVILPIRFR